MDVFLKELITCHKLLFSKPDPHAKKWNSKLRVYNIKVYTIRLVVSEIKLIENEIEFVASNKFLKKCFFIIYLFL